MIVAFDECSIIHTFAIPVPSLWEGVFGKNIKSDNYEKLNTLLNAIKEKGQKPYRFAPSKINIIKQVQDLVKGSILMMQVLIKEIKKSVEKFLFELDDWGVINRCEECSAVRKLFEDNERPLKKNPKIPEDEDCEIIAGYDLFDVKGVKILVSQDEHFWGYKDLIKEKFEIKIIEEWNAHIVAKHL